MPLRVGRCARAPAAPAEHVRLAGLCVACTSLYAIARSLALFAAQPSGVANPATRVFVSSAMSDRARRTAILFAAVAVTGWGMTGVLVRLVPDLPATFITS